MYQRVAFVKEPIKSCEIHYIDPSLVAKSVTKIEERADRPKRNILAAAGPECPERES